MIRRALRRLRSEDAGLSLAELLVSGLLTIVIMAMVGSMFVQTAKITIASTHTTASNNVASNIANELTSSIRVATTLAKSGQILPDPAVAEASREKLVIYSLSNTSASNPAPVRITVTVKADRTVNVERCTAVESGGFWTFGSCGSLENRNLGGALTAVSGTDQLFTYYTSSNTVLNPGAGSLSATDRAKIAKIKVYVSVQATAGSSTKPAVISNLVVLGNLGLDTGL